MRQTLNFTIRPAVAGDLEFLWPMVRRAVAKMNAQGSEQWGEDYPTQDFYAQDIAGGQLWVAAGAGEEIHGVALITDQEEESYRPIPWEIPSPAVVIHRMAVDPALQRSGVGSALFRHAEGLAQAWGISALHVDTYSKNASMRALILGRGFVQKGEIRLHDRPLGFLCFEKVLGTGAS